MSGADFWSRRKAAVAAEARAEVAAEDAAREALLEQERAARDDSEILAELGLREPEALETADEVRTFLAAAVPQRLRSRALRRLWRLNPALANLDGLVDYGEDFTGAGQLVENLQTVYEVGRGMVDRATRAAEAAEADAQETETAAVRDAPAAEASEAEPAGALTPAETPVELAGGPVTADRPSPAATAPEPADHAQPAAPRRMRFRFATG